MTDAEEAALDARLGLLLDHDPELVRHIIRLADEPDPESRGRMLIDAGRTEIQQGEALLRLADLRDAEPPIT